MTKERELVLEYEKKGKITFSVREALCIGFSGRDKEKAMEHIRELEEIGVPCPETIPAIYPCSNQLVTTGEEIQVVGDNTSGEVEFCLIIQGDQLFIGLGSDHTDRDLETISIPKAKQVCPKPLAPQVWAYEEVVGHWDELVLRSWVTTAKGVELYQEGAVANILPVKDILAEITGRYTGELEGIAVFSGTVPTKSGLIAGQEFEMELEDPVLGRKITHKYAIRQLVPQG